MSLERIFTLSPGFDKRNPDPHKNYGIHGCELRFVVRGPKAAVQFVVYTDWFPVNVQNEGRSREGFRHIKPDGADVGYHAYTPQYEGQTPMGECQYLGQPCYYDGSSLRAGEWVQEKLLVGGSDAIWAALEEEYQARFEEPPCPTD